eukprot:TRINITY_DN30920_c0_g1_i1.p1 TRINITY_DN30920_c0_g1~~TRINITY_DN30920_c0_g1_i1.p1  ORF type:complete len:436 (-),score=87.85 TRINITY_DN30920_c0_g1_i1:255-1562(-)
MQPVKGLTAAFTGSRLYEKLRSCEPAVWRNTHCNSSLEGLPIGLPELEEAQRRWQRFAPLLASLFPDEAPEGRIASILEPLPIDLGLGASARCFVKKDSHLPVCASVKARGGLYEVFCRAEDVATEKGMLSKEENYTKLASPDVRAMLSEQEVAVGSTGNLGMSVGLAAASLGMRSTVHMSLDAKAWKKALLRSRGVTVVEHSGLYGKAVAEGRRLAEADPNCHFVDDEASTTLFLGYSAAARELQAQLQAQSIEVSEASPLVVYIPCGVGGAPAGICWGLKHCFGENVHIFFAEPTHAPCVTLGLASELHDDICVQDLGIDGKTEADGLAVSRASGLSCKMVKHLLAGAFTVQDDELFVALARLLNAGGSFMEPSCCAALLGPQRLREAADEEPSLAKLLECGTHVFWATGGALVPEAERESFYSRGKDLLTRL